MATCPRPYAHKLVTRNKIYQYIKSKLRNNISSNIYEEISTAEGILHKSRKKLSEMPSIRDLQDLLFVAQRENGSSKEVELHGEPRLHRDYERSNAHVLDPQ